MTTVDTVNISFVKKMGGYCIKYKKRLYGVKIPVSNKGRLSCCCIKHKQRIGLAMSVDGGQESRLKVRKNKIKNNLELTRRTVGETDDGA